MPNFEKNTNPVMKRSCYKMKGFSGFGNTPTNKLAAKKSKNIDINKDGERKTGCSCGKMKCNC